jgi:hypothetical protein
VEYWSEGSAPVILVCSHPETDECWWTPVSELLKDPERRRSRRVDFNKRRDRFDDSAASSLLDLAAPAVDSRYVPTVPKREKLTSNLLPVTRIPPTIWAAPSIVGNNAEAWELLRRHAVYASDWMVLDRTVFSFRRPDEGPLSSIVHGASEAIDASEWADAKSPDQLRNFVRLLTQTLAEMHHRELRRHPKRHYLHFRATDDLLERRVSTGKSKTGRVVFRAYPDESDPSGAQYFRHHALDHQFVRLDGVWFLELNPTYHFTADGYRDLPWGADLVKGMKRREKNSAVRALVGLWAGQIQGRHDLFTNEGEAPLRFGELATFAVDRGVDERAWARGRPAAVSSSEDAPTLFEAS